MREAMETCLQNYRTQADTIPELQSDGWSVAPYIDAGTYEITRGGVHGIVSPGSETEEGYCMVQSPRVSLPEAMAIGGAVVEDLFSGQYQEGRPEGPAQPCDGHSIFASRKLIVTSYSSAGNSGECIDSGSAIIMNL